MSAGTRVAMRLGEITLSEKRIYSWRFDDGALRNARAELFPPPEGGWVKPPTSAVLLKDDNTMIGYMELESEGLPEREADMILPAGAIWIDVYAVEEERELHGS